MNKDSRLVELLHDLTQKEISVTFSRDFKGMMTVSWGDELEKHTHVGTPHYPLKHLEKNLINLLAELLEEEK